MNNKYFLFYAFAFMLAIASCNVTQDKNKDSITSGKLKLGADDSYSLMMDSQVYTYTHLNKYAAIDYHFKPEADIVDELLKDSIQSAVISRPLNESEMAYFKSIKRLPESIKIATDGIALIVNPANKDSVLTMEQLSGIFTGKDSTWSRINTASKLGKINVVFDNNKSCNARSLMEFFHLTAFPSNCFAVHSNEEVFKYVSEHPGSIGVVSTSWISDLEDSRCRAFAEKIRTIGLIDPNNSTSPEMARRPHQAYIADKTYPLRRDVYYIRTGLSGSLGTGFANHLAGEKGQLIIHKMGMVSATIPTRTIRIID
jgi:phosphate transport system substrate-binding protein